MTLGPLRQVRRAKADPPHNKLRAGRERQHVGWDLLLYCGHRTRRYADKAPTLVRCDMCKAAP